MDDGHRRQSHLGTDPEVLLERIEALEDAMDTLRRELDGLRASEERLRAIFEHAPDGIYLCDFTGTFVDGNRRAEEIIGYARDELIGRNVMGSSLLPPHQLPRAATRLLRSSLGIRPGPETYTLRKRDGSETVVETQTDVVEINGKRLIVGIAREIGTAHRRHNNTPAD